MSHSTLQGTLKPKVAFLSAEVIDDHLLIDMISLLYQSRRQVAFTLWGGDHQATLYFERGSVHYAQSDIPHSRLGEILLQRALIDTQQLENALKHAGKVRLGEALCQLGYLEKEQLRDALHSQALLVIQGALNGDPQRVEWREYELEELPIHLHIDAQGLLLEALRQKDEVNVLLDRLPPLDSTPIALRSPQRSDAVDVQRLLARCDGLTPMSDLIFKSALSALQAVKLCLSMLDGALIDVHGSNETAPLDRARSLIQCNSGSSQEEEASVESAIKEESTPSMYSPVLSSSSDPQKW
jgi:hypothetical protein